MQKLVLEILMVRYGYFEDSEETKLEIMDIGYAFRHFDCCGRLSISLAKLVQSLTIWSEYPSCFR